MIPGFIKSRHARAVLVLAASVVAATTVVIAPAADADIPLAGGDYIPLPSGGLLYRHAVGADATVTVPVLGVVGIPTSNVSAILVDVEAESTTAATYIDVFPAGAAHSSMLNVPAKTPGQSNSAVVPVSSDGKISIYNRAGTSGIAVDIEGYYTESDSGSGNGGLVPVHETTVADSRSGIGTPKKTLAANGSVTVNVAGGSITPIPLGAKSVYVGFAVPGAPASGYISAQATSGGATNAFSVYNFPAGSSSDSFTVVPDANGNVTFTNHSSNVINFVVSVDAYTSPVHTGGSGFRPARQRLGGLTTIAAGASIDVAVGGRPGIPTNGVAAAALNFTLGAATKPGYLVVGPKGGATPGASTMLFNTTQVASAAWVQTGADAKITIRNAATASIGIYIDVAGVYTSTHPVVDPPRFSPTVAQEYTTSGSTLKGLEYTYVDNTGRLLVGTQADESKFDGVQYTTSSSLADVFTGTPDLTITGSTAQVTAEYSDTGVRAKSAAAGTAPSASTAFTNFGGSFAGSPDVTTMPNGSLAQFAVDTDGALWTLPQGGAEPWWHDLGNANLAGTPTVTPVSNGVRITAATRAGTVSTATYVNGVLSSWTDLGGSGIVTRPAVTTRPGFLAQVVATRGDGTVVTRAQRSDGTFADGLVVGGPDDDFRSAGAPAVVFDGVTGQIEVLARSSSDGFIYSSGETTQGSQQFRTWQPVSGAAAASDPTMTPLSGSTGGWVGVYRTPQNATKVVQPTYGDGSAAAGRKTFAGTTTTQLAAPHTQR